MVSHDLSRLSSYHHPLYRLYDVRSTIMITYVFTCTQVNAEKVAVSGKKRTQKLYRRHSGRPGGMKVETFDQLQNRIPERIIEHAVRGMLPKGRVKPTSLSVLLPLSPKNKNKKKVDSLIILSCR